MPFQFSPHEFAVRHADTLPISVVEENLLLGPTSVDPRLMSELRNGYWRTRGERQRNRFRDVIRALEAGRPLVLWMSDVPEDQLLLCWLCYVAACREGLPIFVVEIDSLRPKHHAQTSMGEARPAQKMLGSSEIAWRRDLWRSYCSRSPSRFCEAAGTAGLVALATCYRGFFPRRSGKRLRLSQLDEAVLGAVDGARVTEQDLLVAAAMPTAALAPWLARTGDGFLVTRLAAWQHHQAIAVRRRRDAHPLRRAEYYLTALGERILHAGLRVMAEAPPLEIGGSVAYRSRWVR
jgi:hypothetical protein